MKRSLGLLVASAAVLALAACGGSDDPQPKVAVDDLPAGRYVVGLGDVNAPTVGRYYAAADGSRLLVVTDGADRAQQLYRRDANSAWVAVPSSSKDVALTLLRSDRQPMTSALSASSFAGRYASLLASGTVASFSIDAAGTIVAGASACKLSGRLVAGPLPDTLKLELTTSGCGTVLPASATGVVAVDRDDAPARFRMVGDNGNQLLDLWAYAE